ncbi:MAG TPA: hypothetical protein VGG99_10825 [Acetobacteraceae bacterium]|jgi:hypothetical protein
MAKKARAKRPPHAKSGAAPRRQRFHRTFPASSFDEPLAFAQEIYRIGSGQSVKRLTLFDQLRKSPESGPSRQLIIDAGRYGLTKGGVQADSIELTPLGLTAVDDQANRREQAKARVDLAIRQIEPFGNLYDKFVGTKLPAKAVLIDAAKDIGIPAELAPEAVDTFVVNLRFVGLLKTLSGAERIVSVDMLTDDLPVTSLFPAVPRPSTTRSTTLITAEHAKYESTCFYIAPIGDEGTEARRHSDLFLGSLVEPAMEEFGLTVIRADAIDQPGVITRQVIEYIVKSRLVIADLSYHNPNVFYELALRHAVKRPIVQIVRTCDRVPFDVNQMRTIDIDTADIYSLVPKIESYRAEIANQVRRALEPDHVVDTPISIYLPNLIVKLE